jgi:DNA polymerase-4
MESAKNIMERINRELGLWCSIGISENKFLSKMASEMKKPMGITELWRRDIKEKMWPLPVMRMYGVGKQTAKKLQDMGIINIKDLAMSEKSYLIDKLGKMGSDLYLQANGIDTAPVTLNSDRDMKSIGRSVTLSHDTTDIEYAKMVLLELSDDVGMNARKYGKKGNKVQISIKYSNFKSITRQTTVPATCLVKDIYSAGLKLLEKNWNKQPIRLLGISLSGFNQKYESDQLSLFELPKLESGKNDIDRIDSLENTIHNIREKYGSSIIKQGSFIKKSN